MASIPQNIKTVRPVINKYYQSQTIQYLHLKLLAQKVSSFKQINPDGKREILGIHSVYKGIW